MQPEPDTERGAIPLAPAAAHTFGRLPHAQKRADDVDLVHAPKRLDGQVRERRRVSDAGRRRQRVERSTEHRQSAVEQCDDRLLVGNVDLERVTVDVMRDLIGTQK